MWHKSVCWILNTAHTHVKSSGFSCCCYLTNQQTSTSCSIYHCPKYRVEFDQTLRLSQRPSVNHCCPLLLSRVIDICLHETQWSSGGHAVRRLTRLLHAAKEGHVSSCVNWWTSLTVGQSLPVLLQVLQCVEWAEDLGWVVKCSLGLSYTNHQ